MPRFARLLAAAFVIVLLPLGSRADEGYYPIKADDGTTIANHRVPVELASQIEKLPGIIVLGNPHGDVTLNEFYDLNCPFCRAASAEIEKLLTTMKELKLVLVPYAVLGIPSIQAGKVEQAVIRLAPPKTAYAFYRKAMASRGVMDGNRAFAVAKSLGLDIEKVSKVANGKSIPDTMIAHVRLGSALGIQATPGFVIKGVAINGYPGDKAMARLIDSVERCDSVVCPDK